MERGKWIFAVAAIALWVAPAVAAENAKPTQRRTVAVWRGEGVPEPPEPPTNAETSQLEIPPLPDEGLITPAPTPIAAPDSPVAGCTSSGCTDGGACGATCVDAYGCGQCAPFWAHRSFVYGGLMYLHPTGSNVAYGQQQTLISGTFFAPSGRVGVVDSSYTEAFRIGFAYALSDCASLQANYANFASHQTDTLFAGQNNGDTVTPLLMFPGDGLFTTSRLDASYDVDFRTADLEYRRLLLSGPNTGANYLVGLRYGKLTQKYQQSGVMLEDDHLIQNEVQINFEGLGLRTGLDYERQICASRFSAYGKGFLNLLFGHADARFEQFDADDLEVETHAEWRDERLMPVLEYELGIHWYSPSGAWRFGTGYYMSFWFNAVTPSQFVQAVQRSNFVNLGETIAFDGLVTRLEYRF